MNVHHVIHSHQLPLPAPDDTCFVVIISLSLSLCLILPWTRSSTLNNWHCLPHAAWVAVDIKRLRCCYFSLVADQIDLLWSGGFGVLVQFAANLCVTWKMHPQTPKLISKSWPRVQDYTNSGERTRKRTWHKNMFLMTTWRNRCDGRLLHS